MRVGVVGINHKLADLQLRELLAVACQRRFGHKALSLLHPHVVLLSTCNRTEIYFCSDDLAATHTQLLAMLRGEVGEEFDQKLYSFFGHDCFSHLSRVTSGLDSAVLAETEIQGQVKGAYEQASQRCSLPGDLHYLFQKSLKVGKKIRSEIALPRGLPNLEQAIYNTGKHFFQNLAGSRVLFVGASTINQKLIAFFSSKQLQMAICNRTPQKSHDIAAHYPLEIVDWSQLNAWHHYDWIIWGTSAPDYLLTTSDIPKELNKRCLLMDLSVPRNVEASVGRHPAITLLNIDQVNRLVKIREKHLDHTIAKAESLIAHLSNRYVNLFLSKEKKQRQHLAVS